MTTMDLGGSRTRGLWGRRVFLSLSAFLAIGVALVSFRYFADLGPPPPNLAGNRFADPWLLAHVGCASTALLIGWTQFLPAVRRRWPAAHRWTGRSYVVACLVGGLSGLMLALGTTAGPVGGLGFGLLAAGWIVTTSLGWRTAMERRFDEHRRWMIRSWALTLAAVTLRLYLPLAFLLPFPFAQSYIAIAWLCWVPNLLVAEWWLRRRAKSTMESDGIV